MSQSPSGRTERYENDEQLIEGCRRGEAQAWAEVLDRYERLVYSIPLNYGLTVADAADIAQLTFTIFLQSLDQLDDDSNLSAWLATVARRHSWRLLDRRKRQSVGTNADLSEQLYRVPDKRGAQAFERSELLQWLTQGLNALDERCRRLLLALYFSAEEVTYAEVAAQFDMAVGSVGPTRARCLERLKSVLEDLA